ncbi:MAG TPA: ABC transporter permease [Candidatus Acidoferrales bacterium]|nr:ABC transporter permease [Candidatus Acidoferrales bacterium]
MYSFISELRQILRRLGRVPMFTVITLITLAAGVGANTVVFSVLEGVLLKPLPYPNPDELVGVRHTAPGIQIKDLNMSPSNYFVYRDQNKTFQDIALYLDDSVSITGVGEPEKVKALLVTDGTLRLLGVSPMLGRTFAKQDDSPGAPETAVITYGYWRRKFGADVSVIDRNILVNGKSRQIIGVLPQRFHFLDWDDPAIIIPFQFDRNEVKLGDFSYEGLARLKRGVTLEQANADVARMLPIVLGSFPAPPGFSLKIFEDAHIGPNVRPLKRDVVGDVGSVLWVLMGSIGVVLLIACANVANLLLIHVEGRRQELAVRSALGASRARIASALLLEILILGLLGSAIGLGLAYAALRVLAAIAPSGLPRIREIGIDGPVLLFTLIIALLASILSGSIPIFKYAGTRVNTGIREGGRSLSQSKEQHRMRSGLVIVQVALALVLLICSGLMIRTFSALTNVNPGFVAPTTLQTFRISVGRALASEDEQVVRIQEEICRRLAAIPGVSSVGITSQIPMTGEGWADPLFLEDLAYAEGQVPPLRRFKFISPGYLGALGVPLVAGREFTWDDIYKKIPVVMISENVARELWHDPSAALGKRIRSNTKDRWREIIGVVGNVYDNGVDKPAATSVYWPLMMDRFDGRESFSSRDVEFVLRSPRTNSESFLNEVRQVVWSLNSSLPLAEVHALDFFYRRSLARTRFALIMLGVAGGMALLLGVIGIYGVIGCSVSQRTREIGIRMALGAQQKALVSMFVRHGLTLTAIGVAVGLVSAFAVVRLMSSLLFKVSPVDPVVYGAAAIGLIATALLASYLPSRRASAVDPIEALRAE